ncbi:MAG: nucleotidyltransferase family protein [Paracoccaceae bacterium]
MKMSVDHICIAETATLREAAEAIDKGALQIALVVTPFNKLLATVTDGDIRRALLRGLGLDAPVSEAMNRQPLTGQMGESPASLGAKMRARGVHQIPLLNEEGRLVDLFVVEALSAEGQRRTNDSEVFLMAGGLGLRLRPLTLNTPKPMLQIGGKPLLELIIDNFMKQGFQNFTISINYLGHVIRDHFGDGSSLGISISYVEEAKPMGTAGALSLLPETPTRPVIVMNADLLSSVRFEALMSFHNENGALATVCAREHKTQIPYGVLRTEGTRLVGIEEKPTICQYVNAGIYILSPELMRMMTPETPIDMPELLQRGMEWGGDITVFPLMEDWIDIGRHEDLERAQLAHDVGDID